MKYTALVIISLCLSGNVFAATVVESKTPAGQTQKILLDGQRARMEGGAPGAYMLMFLDTGKMYAINDSQKQVMDMSIPSEAPAGMTGGKEESPAIETKLVSKGAGPEIAGYSTEHYQVTANGEICSNEYIASKVLELPDIKTFLVASNKMTADRKKPMPFMRMEPCMRASFELADQMENKGMSLRSVDKEGKTRHEVVSIQTGVETPPGAFDLPQDYTISTPQEMMQKAMQQMQDRIKNMTPEEREQMQKMHQSSAPQAGAAH